MKEFNISGGYKLQGGYLDITDHRQTSWMSVCGHSEWTEQIRERAFVHVRVWPVCMCAWLSMHECEPMCASLIIHVWFNTVGHQQLWQASAVERDECCHCQVTPDHSQNDLLSSHFLSSSSSVPPLPSQSITQGVQRTAGLDWAWKNTSVQWPLDYFYHREHERTVYDSFMISTHIFLWMPDKHPPTASLAPSWDTREAEAALK